MVRAPQSLCFPPPLSSSLGARPRLACLLTGYSPQGAVVSWQVDGTEFGGGTKLIINLGVGQPTLTVLPPSREELKQGSATLVCLASGGFPSAWTLGWKGGVQQQLLRGVNSLEVLGRDGHYSWSSHPEPPCRQWRKAGSVSCEASLSGQRPVTQSLEPEPLLRVELQQHFLSANDAASLNRDLDEAPDLLCSHVSACLHSSLLSVYSACCFLILIFCMFFLCSLK
ncbi:uncharacterized protein LOC119474461 [Sebastes umbrosus]|uniref:uncharacterized protein LOC119474461 n=1 Tax=Sebastes umbrosus TaxID=72105 RepID=UPI00189EB4F7|nr:uncharacterized protein LOC119474461 [Sebastes umbrosus]